MAAPTVTARQTPVGLVLKDGFSTQIAFARDPNISFWEKSVKPAGIDGGEAINLSTMHNEEWRTFCARQLKTMTNARVTAAYDPAVSDQIEELINQEGSVTEHMSDGTTRCYYGYLKSWEPGDHREGEFPEATLEIVCTNRDPDTGEEEGPVVASVAGT